LQFLCPHSRNRVGSPRNWASSSQEQTSSPGSLRNMFDHQAKQGSVPLAGRHHPQSTVWRKSSPNPGPVRAEGFPARHSAMPVPSQRLQSSGNIWPRQAHSNSFKRDAGLPPTPPCLAARINGRSTWEILRMFVRVHMSDGDAGRVAAGGFARSPRLQFLSLPKVCR